MQVSGKILVLTTFAIGFAMAGGAWWYNYQQSRLTAEFWGPDDAKLIVGSEKLELLELETPSADSTETDKIGAGRAIRREYDLTSKPGLVHLRYALTYDGDFAWAERHSEPVADGDWAYALRFSKGGRHVAALFNADFTRLGKLDDTSQQVDALPCPELGPVLVEYLSKKDVGALKSAEN